MKFENIRVYNFEHALRGMRNPKNSWHLSDSSFGAGNETDSNEAAIAVVAKWAEMLPKDEEGRWNAETYQSLYNAMRINGVIAANENYQEWAYIGPKDMNLAQGLIRGGSEHRKFLRQIMVTVDITAPLYWWKEFDTYKVGTAANSTSTMHKLTANPITIDCFETDDYVDEVPVFAESNVGAFVEGQEGLIEMLENLRLKYLELTAAAKSAEDADEARQFTCDAKLVWKELVRWLPESWLQTRTVTLNYENLLSMYHQRRHHKLGEWSGIGEDFTTPSFMKFILGLPYAADLICIVEEE